MCHSELLKKSEKFGTKFTHGIFLDILYGMKGRNEVDELIEALDARFNQCLDDPRKVHYISLYSGLKSNCLNYLEVLDYMV